MAHKTRYEKAQELLAQAKAEQNPDTRRIMQIAADRYFNADAENPMSDTPDRTKDILLVMVAYVIIFLSVVISFALLSFFAAVLVIIGTFALLCLMMGVILRIQGLLDQPGLLSMVREGFKALLLLRRSSGKPTADQVEPEEGSH